MKLAKTVNPNVIVLPDGRKLIRKSLYTGKLLVKTPELESKIEALRKEISNWQIELYNMEKANSMFISNRNVQNKLNEKMNEISSTIQSLKNKMKELKQEQLKSQPD